MSVFNIVQVDDTTSASSCRVPCRNVSLPADVARIVRLFLTTVELRNAKAAIGAVQLGPLTLQDYWDVPVSAQCSGAILDPCSLRLYLSDLQLEPIEGRHMQDWSCLYQPDAPVPLPCPNEAVAHALRWAFRHRLRFDSNWRWAAPQQWHTAVFARLQMFDELVAAARLGWSIDIEAMNAAVGNCDLAMVRWLHERGVEWGVSTFTSAVEGAAQGKHEHRHRQAGRACAGGNGPPPSPLAQATALLEYLYANKCPLDERKAVCSTARYGSVHVLQWLFDKKSIDRQLFEKDALRTAAGLGHLPVLQWAHACGMPMPATLSAQASAQGHLPVLQWLVEVVGAPWGDTAATAAENEESGLLEWAIRHGVPWCKFVLLKSATCGWIRVLDAAFEVGWSFDFPPIVPTVHLCALAAGNGQLDALKWLRAHGCAWSHSTAYRAARAGWVNTLSYALEGGCPANAKLMRTSMKHSMTKDVEWYLDGYIEARKAKAKDI